MKEKKEPVSATTDRELSITRLFNAAPETMWEVWTKPEHISQWWGPNGFTNTIHTMEVKVTGLWEFVMHGPDGVDYKNKNVFVEIVKPRKIVFDHVSEPWHRTTITFEKQGSKTLMTMHMLFETAAVKDQTVKTHKADVGLRQNMERLEEYLEKTPIGLLAHQLND
jgi:uncharacterized protein YndB with AHSA1/START domain